LEKDENKDKFDVDNPIHFLNFTLQNVSLKYNLSKHSGISQKIEWEFPNIITRLTLSMNIIQYRILCQLLYNDINNISDQKCINIFDDIRKKDKDIEIPIILTDEQLLVHFQNLYSQLLQYDFILV
jgi:hypothetical protein